MSKYSIYSLLVFFVMTMSAEALGETGTIDGGAHTARVCHDNTCSTFGTLNFLPTSPLTAVSITDTAITGYIWGDEIGWVNLAPTGGGVTVDPNTGILYGSAFSQISGWINFKPTNGGVTITSNGEFSGYAWAGGMYGGWIRFDCSQVATCVKTDWRAIPYRNATTTPPSTPSGGGGGFIPPIITLPPVSTTTQATSTLSMATSTKPIPVVLPTQDNGVNNTPENIKYPITSDRADIPSSGGVVSTSGIPAPTIMPNTTQAVPATVAQSEQDIIDAAASSTVKNKKTIISYPFIPQSIQKTIPVTAAIGIDLVSALGTVVTIAFFLLRLFL